MGDLLFLVLIYMTKLILYKKKNTVTKTPFWLFLVSNQSSILSYKKGITKQQTCHYKTQPQLDTATTCAQINDHIQSSSYRQRAHCRGENKQTKHQHREQSKSWKKKKNKQTIQKCSNGSFVPNRGEQEQFCV